MTLLMHSDGDSMSYKVKWCLSTLACFGILALLVNCSGSANGTDSFSCLENKEVFAYPVDQWVDPSEKPTTIPPSATYWEIQYTDPLIGFPDQIIARGEDQIWILGSRLLMYSISERGLAVYSLSRNGASDYPSEMYLAEDGTLWLMGAQQERNGPLLSRFDDFSNTLLPIQDSRSILPTNSFGRGSISEDSQGRLWLLVFGDGVYVYDPFLNEAEKVLDQTMEDGSIIDSMAIDSNDNLWLGTGLTGVFRHVQVFNYQNGKLGVLPLGINEDDIDNSLLVVDDRLWIGDYAYWTIGNELPKEGYSGLTKLVRSTVFLSQKYPNYNFRWIRPKVLMADSEGNIWYTSYGLVMLNPSTGVWCKVLDSDAIAIGIAQDSQGNYWTAMDNSLYKHWSR